MDFTPFTCAGCGGVFCVDHRSAAGHACAIAPRPAQDLSERDASSSTSVHLDEPIQSQHRGFACSYGACRAMELVRVACPLCNAVTCLAHRSPGEHACPRADRELTAAPRIGGQGVTSAADRLALTSSGGAGRGHGSSTVSSSSPSSSSSVKASSKPLSAKDAALARSVALMRIKGKVPLDQVRKVPEASRCFLEVKYVDSAPFFTPTAHDSWREGNNSSTEIQSIASISGASPVMYACADTNHSVGALIDQFALKLGVANPNATTADEALRLHLYAVPSAIAHPYLSDAVLLMPFSTKLSQLVKDSVLISGGSLLLVRGLILSNNNDTAEG